MADGAHQPHADLILSSTHLGLWDWNMQTGETAFDQRWAEIIGYTLAELQPVSIETWQKYAHPDDLDASDALIQQCVSGLRPYYDIEVRMRHRDGHWVWVRDRGQIVEWDADGKPVRMVGTHEDISQRVAERLALAASERQYTAMFSDHDAVMLLVEPGSGTIVDANKAAVRFYGYTLDELRGMPITTINVMAPDEVALRRQRAAQRNEQYFVFPHRLASGEIRMVDVHSSPIVVHERTLLFSIVRDVTAHLRGDLLELIAGTITDLLGATSSELDAVMDRSMQRAAGTFTVDRAHLLTLVADGTVRRAWGWPEPARWSDGEPVQCPWLTGATTEVRTIPDTRTVPLPVRGELQRLGLGQATSMLILPLQVGGHSLGFAVFDTIHGARRWNDDEVEVMRLVTGALAQALDRRSVLERLERADLVLRNTDEATLVLDPQRRIVEVNPAFTRMTGYEPDEVIGRHPRMLGSNRHSDDFYSRIWNTIDRIGYWRGEMWSKAKDGRFFLHRTTFSAVDGEAGPEGYVVVIDDITRLSEQEERLEMMAYYDALTGLPNRPRFHQLLTDYLSSRQDDDPPGALLLMDIDRLKTVNDSYGHSAGDHVIATVATRLASGMPSGTSLARFAGNSFAMLLRACADLDMALDVAREANAAIGVATPVPGGGVVYPTVCAGALLIDCADCGAEDVLRNADAALHAAKSSGPGSLRAFAGDLVHHTRARLNLEAHLRQAWETRQLTLEYQPQFEVDGVRLGGVEALLRWRTPEGERVAPSVFIPLAEEIGLIREIGVWVLEQACRQGRAWHDAGLVDLQVSVNLSAAQLPDDDLVDTLSGILNATGFPAEKLEIELTESTVLAAEETSDTFLERLPDLGVHLSIDDFGTGYSSFSALKRLPLDQLKVDLSLIRDIAENLDDRAITSAIIAMGHTLGLKVLAEGVETQEQLEILRELGCDRFQGFLMSPSLTPEEFARRFLTT